MIDIFTLLFTLLAPDDPLMGRFRGELAQALYRSMPGPHRTTCRKARRFPPWNVK